MELISQLLAVVAVLTLAAAAAWLLRRGRVMPFSRLGGVKGLIEVVEKRVVTQQLTIHVIRVGATQYVLASSGTNVTVLKEEQR